MCRGSTAGWRRRRTPAAGYRREAAMPLAAASERAAKGAPVGWARVTAALGQGPEAAAGAGAVRARSGAGASSGLSARWACVEAAVAAGAEVEAAGAAAGEATSRVRGHSIRHSSAARRSRTTPAGLHWTAAAACSGSELGRRREARSCPEPARGGTAVEQSQCHHGSAKVIQSGVRTHGNHSGSSVTAETRQDRLYTCLQAPDSAALTAVHDASVLPLHS